MNTGTAGAHRLRKGRFSREGGIYFVTFSTYGREPRFSSFVAAAEMSRQLHGFSNVCDCRVLCWVVMPDHVHLLLQVGSIPLSRAIQQLKSLSAIALNRVSGRRGRIWSRGFHDHALRRHESVVSVSRYIIFNPISAGLAPRPSHYPFWNATWL